MRTLEQGLEQLELAYTQQQLVQVQAYLSELGKWNKHFNLTAIYDPVAVLPQHVFDCLAILPHLKGERILDVGTGAGLPGLLLAIFEPQKQFALLDSNSKKTRFLVQTAHNLGLSNVEVVHSRVETYQPNNKFETITTRAFSSLANMIQVSQHLLADAGQYLAMKGEPSSAELQALDSQQWQTQLIELSVPGLAAKRCVVVVKQKDAL